MSKETFLSSIQEWQPGTMYSKNSVVLYNGSLYFCVVQNNFDPISSLGVSWLDTSKFVWQPTFSSPVNAAINNKLANFIGKAGASLIKKDDNKATFLILSLSFKNRSDLELQSILSFLHFKNGKDSFLFDYYGAETKTLKCRCKKYSHNYVAFNCHDIQAQFEEVL